MADTDKTNILDRLVEGITQLTSSERWQEWLTMQSRFHCYSFNNTLLILASEAGSNSGRRVQRLAQARPLRPQGREGHLDPGSDGLQVRCRETTRRREPTKVIRGFKPVPVFDISQTDGAELPEVCIRLDGEDEAGLFERLRTVAASSGSPSRTPMTSAEPTGCARTTSTASKCSASNSPVQRVKTLAHELGHAILHARRGPSRQPGRPGAGGRERCVRRLCRHRNHLRRLQLRLRGHVVRRWRRGAGRHQGVRSPYPAGSRSDPQRPRRRRAGGGGVMYTVADITELIEYHLVASAPDDESADANLAQLVAADSTTCRLARCGGRRPGSSATAAGVRSTQTSFTPTGTTTPRTVTSTAPIAGRDRSGFERIAGSSSRRATPQPCRCRPPRATPVRRYWN